MTLTITSPGLLTTVQDGGRFGYAHLGVPRAGWLDPDAAQFANRLVGNPPHLAVLETTVTGVSFTVATATTIAVTGARATVHVAGVARAWAEGVSVPAGAEVRVGPAIEGLRCYVACAGGIDVTPVLGSRSTDTLAFVGPPVVVRGSVLPIGRTTSQPPESPPGTWLASRRVSPVLLRVHPGPRRDWFAAEELEHLFTTAYAVTSASNRVGLRLDGRPIARLDPGRELASEGMVLGAIQIPPDGLPVVFLNDHPVTGGYPVVGVVDEADLPLCAQLGVGATVHFRQL